jgi:GDP-4-dehydro-6-deoxy-D-mannose reductase
MQLSATSALASAGGRLLVTGHAGFVGQHVLAAARRTSWEVVGPGIEYDLLNAGSIDALVDAVKADAVLHLAGVTFVPDAVRDPENALVVNTLGTLRLLQSLKRTGFQGPFVYVSSGDVYGLLAPEQLPVTEATPAQPRNPYAVSKVAAELVCRQWAIAEGWPVFVARPFNHIGSGQRSDFVVAKIARQIALIRSSRAEPVLKLGDIDVSRDFLDVSDVVDAYFALLGLGQSPQASSNSGEIFNICSGRELTIRALVMRMLKLAGVEADIDVDATSLRASEQRRVVGDNHKLARATGWQPRIDLDQTLLSILTDWEKRINDE